jgi:hypothetical protein
MNKDMRGLKIVFESFNVIILITERKKLLPVCHIADIDSDIAHPEIILVEFIMLYASLSLETVCYIIFRWGKEVKYTSWRIKMMNKHVH